MLGPSGIIPPMSETPEQPTVTERDAPWVQLRSAMYRTFIYQKMVKEASPGARAGDCVAVYDRNGELFGRGLYNPNSAITLRMLTFDATPIDESFWREALGRAVGLRRDVLRLDDVSDAYRLVHAEGDELSGLVVDRYRDILSISVYSHGMWRALDALLPPLHETAGTTHHVVQVDERVQKQEGFAAKVIRSDGAPSEVNVTEHGVRFKVRFDIGHKTGFFCDQRDNRRRLASMASGAEVLDLCCYGGGFGVYSMAIGNAKAATCVDLDEDAVALARKNANLNQLRVDTVQADAFTYMRQMQANGRTFGVVVLDPPKLIFGRNDTGEGRHKYADLNRLAAALVAPGGILLTCSCSGALAREDFLSIVTGAVRHAGRHGQVLDVTGAAPDHPVSPRCPESAYLKAAWLRLW